MYKFSHILNELDLKEYLYARMIMLSKIKRRLYLFLKRKRLKRKTVSVISNNCLAGIVCSDLHIMFNTPTVNLFFETDDDYIEFLSDLDYYMFSEIHQKHNTEFSWPVGEIVNGNNKVTIHFMHYNSFENAKWKWCERSKRLDKNNLYVLWYVENEFGPTEDLFTKFKQLDFKNKLLITGNQFDIEDKIVKQCDFIKSDSIPGQWLHYKKKFSSKRYIDEIDFVHLFNKMK